MLAPRTVAVELSPGYRVRVVGGTEVPDYLRAAYLRTVGGGDAPANALPAGPTTGINQDPATSEGDTDNTEASLVVLDEPHVHESSDEAADDLEEMKRPALMKRAADAGVPARGSNAELIAAIRAAEAK